MSIPARIAKLRADITDLGTTIACESGALRQWAIELRAVLRADLARLEAEGGARKAA